MTGETQIETERLVVRASIHRYQARLHAENIVPASDLPDEAVRLMRSAEVARYLSVRLAREEVARESEQPIEPPWEMTPAHLWNRRPISVRVKGRRAKDSVALALLAAMRHFPEEGHPSIHWTGLLGTLRKAEIGLLLRTGYLLRRSRGRVQFHRPAIIASMLYELEQGEISAIMNEAFSREWPPRKKVNHEGSLQ